MRLPDVHISILIPTLNRLAYLTESLTSAREQSHRDLEILVSDDGSTDGTREYVREVERTDRRVRLLIDNPEPGIFTNINHLVARASGDAFCILADDDRFDPTFVEHLLEPLERFPNVAVVFCDHHIIDSSGRSLLDATEKNSVAYGRTRLPPGIVTDPIGTALGRTLCVGFAVFRGATFRDRRFDVACRGAADWDFALRAARLGHLFYVPARLGDYRSHPGTATSTARAYMSGGAVQVLQKHRFTDARHEARRRDLLRAFAKGHAYNLLTTDRREALKSVRLALALGASPLDAKLMATAALSVMPRAVAVGVQRAIRRWPDSRAADA